MLNSLRLLTTDRIKLRNVIEADLNTHMNCLCFARLSNIRIDIVAWKPPPSPFQLPIPPTARILVEDMYHLSRAERQTGCT